MQIQLIRTDEDHRAALAEIETLWGAPEGTDDGDRLEALVALVDSYRRGAGRSSSTPHSILSTSCNLLFANSAMTGPSWRGFSAPARGLRKS